MVRSGVTLNFAAQKALAYVFDRSDGNSLDRRMRITLHFHPDRNFGSVTVMESLLRDGVYRSQFETGISNGLLAPYPYSERWRWESRMFGGAYDTAPPWVRPVYGSLNFRYRRNGGSPIFGSAFLRLREEVLDRVTFCYPDSYAESDCFGTADRAGLITFAAAAEVGFLSDYVEAHVHGRVRLDRDVEALVLDPCYRGTEVESVARLLRCPVEWHAGFDLNIEDIHAAPNYRTAEAAALAQRAAAGGRLTARTLGDAVRAGQYPPLVARYAWHYIVRFGFPARTESFPGGGGMLSGMLVEEPRERT